VTTVKAVIAQYLFNIMFIINQSIVPTYYEILKLNYATYIKVQI